VLLPFARELAAVLACGERAVLSHRSAAFVWGLAEPPAEVDVNDGASGSRGRDGIHRRRGALRVDDVAIREGLPVTSCARTLADLASEVTPRVLERAVNEAYVARLVTADELEAVAHRRGAAPLRRLLDAQAGPSFTRSEAERRLLGLLRRAQLPAPATNARIAGFEVDCLWREARLVVEVDGFAFHGTRAAFERDRARDARLQSLGFVVIRVTWRQLRDEPESVIALIARALARAQPAA
jgi:very-short-patch-repair endonuclease